MLMIAVSQKLPDIIMAWELFSDRDEYVKNGILLELSDYIDKILPFPVEITGYYQRNRQRVFM